MDCIVHGVAKSQTQLSNFHFHTKYIFELYIHIYIYIYLNYIYIYIYTEKAMAPHSSTLAWKIPWVEEPGRLQSMGSQRVGHN